MFTARYILDLLEATKWFVRDSDVGNADEIKKLCINAVKTVIRNSISGIERQDPDMQVYFDSVIITFGNAIRGDIQHYLRAEQLEIKIRKTGSRKVINISYTIIVSDKKVIKTTAINSFNQLPDAIKKVYFDPECWTIRKRI